jgi:hypothetical protein
MFESTVLPGRVFTDDSGISYEVPVLMTPAGHADVLLDYLIENWGIRSPDWMVKVTNSVRLFLDYLDACGEDLDGQMVFQNFRQRMLTGTVSAASGFDPTGLWWSARPPKQTNRVIRRLTDFFNWWAKKNPGKSNPAAVWRGSKYDRRLAQAAYTYRRNEAFLGHTWSLAQERSRKPEGAASARKWYQEPAVERRNPASFPEDRILDLVLRGFRVGKRINFRDALITLLLNGAGFRASEPFHLYMWDIAEDPMHKGQALVLIHHPSWGNSPADPKWVDASGRRRQGKRVEYLAERFGLAPRDWGLSKKAAGWKGGMHEAQFGGYYKQAYWFVPEFGELFWQLWNQYAEQVLRIDPLERQHPYAFMNILGEPVGGIYQMGKFETSHAAAVRRIGLEPSRHLGTHIHGHRHAYGKRLRKAGVPKEMVRRFMHHTHIDSQDVYTQADYAECLDHLGAAVKRLDGMTAEMRARIAGLGPADLALDGRS